MSATIASWLAADNGNRIQAQRYKNLIPKLPEFPVQRTSTVSRSGLRALRKCAMISSHCRGHQDLVDAHARGSAREIKTCLDVRGMWRR